MEQIDLENCSVEELMRYTHMLEEKYRLEDEKKKENPQADYYDSSGIVIDMNDLTLYNEIYLKFSVNSDKKWKKSIEKLPNNSIESLNQCFSELELD